MGGGDLGVIYLVAFKKSGELCYYRAGLTVLLTVVEDGAWREGKGR